MIGDYKNNFVINTSFDENTRIHFIEKNKLNNDSLTIVYFPGLWEPAERALPLFDALDYHCVSFSFRGRGLSDTPASGYDLEHHLSDFEAVEEYLQLKQFIIVAFSRGVGYACGYLSKHPEKVKGLIIIDHPPIHIKPYEGYAKFWKNLIYLGIPLTNAMRPEALDALEKEANEFVFWDSLSKLNIPIAVLRGTNENAKISSDLTEDDMNKYRRILKNYREINFEFSGHMIVDEELGKYRQVINEFVKCLEKN